MGNIICKHNVISTPIIRTNSHEQFLLSMENIFPESPKETKNQITIKKINQFFIQSGSKVSTLFSSNPH